MRRAAERARARGRGGDARRVRRRGRRDEVPARGSPAGRARGDARGDDATGRRAPGGGATRHEVTPECTDPAAVAAPTVAAARVAIAPAMSPTPAPPIAEENDGEGGWIRHAARYPREDAPSARRRRSTSRPPPRHARTRPRERFPLRASSNGASARKDQGKSG